MGRFFVFSQRCIWDDEHFLASALTLLGCPFSAVLPEVISVG